MQIRTAKRAGEQGTFILVSLIIAGVAGVTLASYLLMTQHQNVSTYRSQMWNASMVVGEAGIEDGLQLINFNAGALEHRMIYNWTNEASGANWEHPSADVYYIKRYITNETVAGVFTNSYEAWIFNTNKDKPAVVATGYVPWSYSYASAGQPAIFAQSGAKSSQSGVVVTRKVNIETRFDPLFVVAMAAIDRINLNGNDIATDSFDSGDSRYSINGRYPEGHPEMTRDHGDVATDSALVDGMSIGNANIRGHVRTGPGTNTIYVGPNGSVGNQAYVSNTGNDGTIQSGWSSTDFNVTFDPVIMPTNAAWLPLGPASGPSATVDGTNYQFIINVTAMTNDFYILSPPLSSGQGGLHITGPSNALVRVWIRSNVDLRGQDSIRIAPTGVKVRFYVTAASFEMTGNATVDNLSGVADNFYLYGLPTCTYIKFGGNGSFYGGIYAPSAAFTLGGGGGVPLDFVGGSVTRSVTMTGNFRFHFDENLAKIGPGRGYVPTSWIEL